jgi:hypothetical protein
VITVAGMTTNERKKLIRVYLGVRGGYLGDFDNIEVLERFYIGLGLDVDPRELVGTNREKFEQILGSASPSDQAIIIRGSLKMHPPDENRWETRTQNLHDELSGVADRLEGCTTVKARKPIITSKVVEQAINEAEDLIGKRGFPSAVDRVHTMLHGFLRKVCDDEGIAYGPKTLMSGLFSLIRSKHPAFADMGPRKDDVLLVVRSMSAIMDAMNPIRNEGSMAHPNEQLLDPPEAALVINLARTILQYIDMKLTGVEV